MRHTELNYWAQQTTGGVRSRNYIPDNSVHSNLRWHLLSCTTCTMQWLVYSNCEGKFPMHILNCCGRGFLVVNMINFGRIREKVRFIVRDVSMQRSVSMVRILFINSMFHLHLRTNLNKWVYTSFVEPRLQIIKNPIWC